MRYIRFCVLAARDEATINAQQGERQVRRYSDTLSDLCCYPNMLSCMNKLAIGARGVFVLRS